MIFAIAACIAFGSVYVMKLSKAASRSLQGWQDCQFFIGIPLDGYALDLGLFLISGREAPGILSFAAWFNTAMIGV